MKILFIYLNATARSISRSVGHIFLGLLGGPAYPSGPNEDSALGVCSKSTWLKADILANYWL